MDIELVDVYAWLERQCGGIPEHDTAMFFSAEDDKLVLPLGKGKKAIEVPGEDFWQWVTSEQLPLPLRSVEVAYGVPMVVGADEHCLRVNFAASSSDDPRSWADKPACLAEWKHKNLTPIRVEWGGSC
ncbi:hypothetical protein [Ottowia sp.]|uniref:hypothetical protein n=1 Tax=Ottowia sp. TaxID=1898956 RepID=UPI0025D8B358|nr:hypothetical protein [Ottowia sp.]MBK6616614.1 hypothetical protein [Ottowia sp.]